MTTQITLDDYWMGRDKIYPKQLTDEIHDNAVVTVSKVNLVLWHATKDGVVLIANRHNSLVNSGWRPDIVNAATPGAATHSPHLTAHACDISDPTGSLDKWCLANPKVLAEIGLWQESPASTIGWCHLQTIPPHSGRRVFIP